MSLSSISSVSTAGMNAAWNSLGVSAGRIASAATQPLGGAARTVGQAAAPSEAASSASAPSLAADLVGQLQAKNAFLVNLRVFQAGNDLLGSLIDMKA